jgi:hypothetical protein
MWCEHSDKWLSWVWCIGYKVLMLIELLLGESQCESGKRLKSGAGWEEKQFVAKRSLTVNHEQWITKCNEWMSLNEWMKFNEWCEKKCVIEENFGRFFWKKNFREIFLKKNDTNGAFEPKRNWKRFKRIKIVRKRREQCEHHKWVSESMIRYKPDLKYYIQTLL